MTQSIRFKRIDSECIPTWVATINGTGYRIQHHDCVMFWMPNTYRDPETGWVDPNPHSEHENYYSAYKKMSGKWVGSYQFPSYKVARQFCLDAAGVEASRHVIIPMPIEWRDKHENE